MSKPKSKKPSKAEANKRINQRVSKIYIQTLIKETIVPLLITNWTFGEICAELRVVTGKSDSQCQRYVSKAIEVLSQDFNRDIEVQRLEAICSLRNDMTEAYNNYTMERSVFWWKEYQSVKKRIAELSPNELKSAVIKDDGDQTINISFNVDKNDK